jgi:hypothetical protein
VRLAVISAAIAMLAFAGARIAREAAEDEAPKVLGDEPYAPAPHTAPLVTLGYRELFADLLFLRLKGYFGGADSTADGIAQLTEAIIALDPEYQRIYEWGARATTLASRGVDNAAYLRAIAILDAGAARFPGDWKLPFLEGEIYAQDLQTKDPAQRRAWDERGTSLTEQAIRKPNAPAEAATWAATMRTRLGQHQRAIDGLREMLLVTDDDSARARLLAKLAALDSSDADELAAELFEARQRFDAAWQAARPSVPASMYVLIGGKLSPAFDLGDLATGGRDLVGTQPIERLDPVTDPGDADGAAPPTRASGPSNP